MESEILALILLENNYNDYREDYHGLLNFDNNK